MFYSKAFLSTAAKFDVRFSITVRQPVQPVQEMVLLSRRQKVANRLLGKTPVTVRL